MTADARTTTITAIERAVAHLAEALEQLDRMPAGDRTTIDLIAHSLNNYVSVSDATLDLVGHALQRHRHPEVAGWPAALRHRGSLTQHTVGRLVDASTAAASPLRREAFDLIKLMSRACQYYSAAAARKRLEIVCRLQGNIPFVWGDRVAVAVVADNLLSNAVASSATDGTIRVQFHTGPGGVVCSIRDHVAGLPAGLPPHASTSGVGVPLAEGEDRSSYGVSIARELVERMGGQIWFESTPAGGACFSFRVPYPPAEASSKEADGS